MGQIKHKMGNVGGGVDISHKSKMSNAAKNQMSFPGGMPGPGNYGSSDNNVVGRGMAKFISGASVGMRKMDPMYNGQPGTQSDDFLQFDKSGGPSKSGGPAKPKRNADGTIMSPRQIRLAKEKADKKKAGDDFMKKYDPKNLGTKTNPFENNKVKKSEKTDLAEGLKNAIKSNKSSNSSSSSSSSNSSNSSKSNNSSDSGKSKEAMSDMQKIKASKKAKIESAKAKKAEGRSDLKKARETKFVSRGSGEDSGVSTREERRTAIRAARSKKREGRRAERKARKGTVIKQKSVRMRKSDD